MAIARESAENIDVAVHASLSVEKLAETVEGTGRNHGLRA
jgi:hypothetical protein